VTHELQHRLTDLRRKIAEHHNNTQTQRGSAQGGTRTGDGHRGTWAHVPDDTDGSFEHVRPALFVFTENVEERENRFDERTDQRRFAVTAHSGQNAGVRLQNGLAQSREVLQVLRVLIGERRLRRLHQKLHHPTQVTLEVTAHSQS
jgi:hypothetical protein